MTLRPALLIAAKDLRLRSRDRSAWVLGLGAPILIATVMSFAFRSTEQFSMRLAVVDEDGSTMGQAVRSVLDQPELKRVVRSRATEDRSAARRLMEAGSVDATLVVPAGFTEAVGGGSARSLLVLTSPDAQLAGQVAHSIASGFASQIDADRLSVAVALDGGATAPIDRLVRDASRQRLPIQAVERPTGARSLKPVSYFGPSMGIFFVFFAIAFTARGWFLEASEGTLQRMAAATSLRQVLAGKALSVFVYGTVSLTTMAVVTSLAFGADWGGPLYGGLLIVAMGATVVSLTAFVIAVARTERQAEGLASMVVFGLALLGGNFVFVSSAPPLLRRLALLTPNGWAMRGFVDLATGPHSFAAIGPPLAGIGVFGAVVLAVTAALSRRIRLP